MSAILDASLGRKLRDLGVEQFPKHRDRAVVAAALIANLAFLTEPTRAKMLAAHPREDLELSRRVFGLFAQAMRPFAFIFSRLTMWIR
jgi:hypothetical protein